MKNNEMSTMAMRNAVESADIKVIALNKLNVDPLVFRLYSCHYASHYKLNIFCRKQEWPQNYYQKNLE